MPLVSGGIFCILDMELLSLPLSQERELVVFFQFRLGGGISLFLKGKPRMPLTSSWTISS